MGWGIVRALRGMRGTGGTNDQDALFPHVKL